MINYKIICGDVIDSLKQIDDESAHIIITSPPYNLRIHYDNYNDNLPHQQYLKWMRSVWAECKNKLVHGGRICINIDATTNLENETERIHPLHVDFTNQLRELGYIYRGELCWKKFNASGKDTCWGSWCLPSSPHIRRNHEYVVLASKGSLKLEGDSALSDITAEEFQSWTLSDWTITPETRERNHPVPYPRDLVKRLVKLFTYVGNTVLDPFNGSGTTTTTALELGRNAIGIDLSPRYCKFAEYAAENVMREHFFSGGYAFTHPVSHKQDKEHPISDLFPV